MLPHVVSRKRPGTHVSIAGIASVRHRFATKEEDNNIVASATRSYKICILTNLLSFKVSSRLL